MSNETNEKFEKQKARAERARKRQLERIKSKEYQDKQREKQAASRAKQIAKVNSPEYREKQRQKQLLRAEKQAKKARSTNAKKSVSKKKKGYELKGRPATAYENRVTKKLASIGCICCMNKGVINHHISMHHTDGRTKPLAHAKQLPLCAYHHDTPLPAELKASAPEWLIPFHKTGRKTWEALNGREIDLLIQCYQIIGEDILWQ